MKEKVLITGAGRGLGYELTKHFFNHEYEIFPVVRDPDHADKLQKEFPSCKPIIVDITEDSSMEKIQSTVTKYTNVIDIVINNAGIPGREYKFEKVSISEMNEAIQIHCFGVIRVVQAALPILKNAKNPRVINVSSRLGSLTKMASGEFKKRKFAYSYRVAKAAQNMLSICMSNELEEYGISVNSIHPGKIKTRTAASDADLEPHEAAENIFKWVEKLEKGESRIYAEPGVGKLPW
ncbi:SDR family NAD(P)-dependent oxidoreductase [Chengkuizengella axinellae]|uniref:SDR family NAD(P)-dependent oxidoreductase n=1 Tax=Chengkuizengella axinellae TaxID=3064388 RepID=A0ABT9IUG4_9BACL|nr:SDR family NAD(P)-dependent oxidoreductase [Chengkuizengella sp. 2205SS18-9]MDP5272947.1 SDR family NAD(P)-dependent oxidoreductase [Chengkuizengella sp. 2205SS18-9]